MVAFEPPLGLLSVLFLDVLVKELLRGVAVT